MFEHSMRAYSVPALMTTEIGLVSACEFFGNIRNETGGTELAPICEQSEILRDAEAVAG